MCCRHSGPCSRTTRIIGGTSIPEPPPTIYDESYLRHSMGDVKNFAAHGGKELDGVQAYAFGLTNVAGCGSALDVGCGRGELVYALCAAGIDDRPRHRHLTGRGRISAETCSDDMRAGKVHVEVMSATKLAFEDAKFDLVFMTDVVEHLSDENLRAALAEAYRVLRPGGKLVPSTRYLR